MDARDKAVLEIVEAPLTTVAAIPDRFTRLLQALSKDDGIRAFVDVHGVMSRAVSRHHAEGSFEDPDGLARVDIRLVERFFERMARWIREPETVGRAWGPIFRRRFRTEEIHPLQFAIAGIHAHVASDLVWAVLRAHEDMGYGDPELGTPLHEDYCAINDIELALREGVEARIGGPEYRKWDERLGTWDDYIRSWSFARARDKAWVDAMAISRLPGFLADAYTDALDGVTGMANRLLLR